MTDHPTHGLAHPELAEVATAAETKTQACVHIDAAARQLERAADGDVFSPLLPLAGQLSLIRGGIDPTIRAAVDPNDQLGSSTHHLGVSPWTVAADIRKARLPATRDGLRYSIKATDLPFVTEIPAADPASAQPLDRLTCTLVSWPTWSSPSASEQRTSLASTHCATTHKSPPSWPGFLP